MFKKTMSLAAVAGVVFALATAAQGSILASEDYNDGTNANAAGLTYTQGAVTVGEAGALKGRDATQRFIDLSSTPSAGQVFVRALVERPVVTNDWGGVSFFPAGGELVYFGTMGPSRVNWGILNYGTGGNNDNVALFEAGQVYFMVGMIDYDADVAKMWINPTFGATAPAETGSVTNWDKIDAVTRVRLDANLDPSLHFDELVVGTT